MCTVRHALAAVPAVVVVSATTFQVRAMFTQTTPKAGGATWFSFAAYGAPISQPTTSRLFRRRAADRPKRTGNRLPRRRPVVQFVGEDSVDAETGSPQYPDARPQ